jgi:hypothetical protein
MNKTILVICLCLCIIPIALSQQPSNITEVENDFSQYNIWDSGWFYIVANQVFTHNMGYIPRIVICYFSNNSDGSDPRQAMFSVIFDGNYKESGIRIVNITKTTFTVDPGYHLVDAYLNSTGSWIEASTGYCRVILIK